ncbi:hypothetical protein OROGR_028257 [Orobanche gracilis]
MRRIDLVSTILTLSGKSECPIKWVRPNHEHREPYLRLLPRQRHTKTHQIASSEWGAPPSSFPNVTPIGGVPNKNSSTSCTPIWAPTTGLTNS